jgi:hypothetical protein
MTLSSEMGCSLEYTGLMYSHPGTSSNLSFAYDHVGMEPFPNLLLCQAWVVWFFALLQIRYMCSGLSSVHYICQSSLLVTIEAILILRSRSGVFIIDSLKLLSGGLLNLG